MRPAYAIVCASFLAVGCSTGDGNRKDGGDSGDVDSGARDSAGVDPGVDAGLNGCSDFVDRSAPAAARTIVWAYDVSPACILIAAGQTVTWEGPLGYHSLDPFGGDTPSPIVSTNMGSTVSFTFPNEGDYGFHCRVHLAMQGIVRVKR